VKINKITCKSALTGSKGHFTLNPYTGCSHGCVYCYATYMLKYRDNQEPWGTWIDVKTNLVEVLYKQLKTTKPMEIFISTACDSFQPIEAKYGLTGAALHLLAEASRKNPDLSVYILTKSDYITRYLEILKSFRPGAFNMSFSFSTLNDDVAAILEPFAPRPSARLGAAVQLAGNGISTGIMLSPLMPYFTEIELDNIIQKTRELGLIINGISHLNYISSHVGVNVRPIYAQAGKDAIDRLNYATNNPVEYRKEVDERVKTIMR